MLDHGFANRTSGSLSDKGVGVGGWAMNGQDLPLNIVVPRGGVVGRAGKGTCGLVTW